MIDYQSLSLSLTAQDVIILPSYKGSTLRGGFGNAFRRIVCALRKNDCTNCLLKEKCIYSYVFETPPSSHTTIMRKYTTAPHPFIIEPPCEKRMSYKPGDEIVFNLILIGRAIDYLPYFIYTFDELGKIGIGKGRGKFLLKNVAANGNLIYASENKTLKPPIRDDLPLTFPDSSDSPDAGRQTMVTLSFLTPARISFNGHLTSEPEFHVLIRNLMRRIALLCYFHCGGDPSAWDFKGVIEKAKGVTVKENKLRWHDWERYSARQDTRMKMGGFVGEITFEGNVRPFMTLLRAGEVLHVGKATSFGLGKYEIK